MLKLLCVTVLCLTSAYAQSSNKVFYSKDGRVEVYQAKSKWKTSAMSTAALISLDKLKFDPSSNTYRISKLGQSEMGRNLNLCEEVRFREQVNVSTCSGFLIKEDVLLTAGHCASGEMKDICSSGKYAWVFGYQAKKYENTKDIQIKKEDVVTCKSVLDATMNYTIDYAAIRLSRKVNKTPLKLNKNKKLNDKDELVVIGNPWGLPTKVTLGGKVINNKEKYFFTAALDTFQGNSGSAVFNKRTGLVEGILVRGKTDAVMDEDNYCRRVNQCDEQGNNCSYTGGYQIGEDVMRMPFVYKKILSSL